MYLTQSQRNLIESKSLVHVSFSPIKEKEGTLGYSFKDKFYYRIRLDESIKDNEAISMSILIHELGHVELGHMDESLMDAIKYVFKIAEELGISKEIIRLWNRGPMGVINICMDLEVNDKFLTRQNIRDLTNSGFTPVTLEVLNLEPQESWKDYIKPYLSMMKDNYDDLKNQLDDLFKSLKDIGEMQTKRNKGSGKSKSSPQEEDTEDSSLGNMNSYKDAEKVEEGESSTSDSSNDPEGEENEVTQSDMEDDGEDPEEYLDEEGELGELITTSDQNCDDSTSYGLSHEIHNLYSRPDRKSPSKILEDFFMQLLYHEKTMVPDSMKHYNRGTRRNEHGLIYTSISRKVKLKPKKLGILIDVSGSMNSKSLLTALDSLEPLLHMLHKDSVVVAWDTELCGEYPITKLPKSLQEYGGTDMASGLRYLNKKGYDTVVIYSDFETDVYSLYREAKSFGKDLSFIVVNNGNRFRNVDPNNVIKDQKSLVKRVIEFKP